MPKRALIILVVLMLTAGKPFNASGQLSAGACVNSKGLQFLSDAYLASLGACNCQRTGVLLTGFYKCNPGPYVLDFEDNFDGDSLDETKWRLSPSIQGALDGAQRMDLFTLNNVRVENGLCRIIAKKETVTARAVNYKPDNEILADGRPNLRTYHYTSSLLSSWNKYSYGKYEIRCRMPKGNGLWPAFWLFGGAHYNEIDIFDCYKGINTIVNCVYNNFEDDGKPPTGCAFTYKHYDLSEWHTFTCLYDVDQISFLVDDNLITSLDRITTPANEPVNCGDNISSGTYYQLKAFPLEPMNIIFNMTLISEHGPGGSVPVEDSTPFPSSFDVDYIRYWKRVDDRFDIFPNPASGQLNIKSAASSISNIAIHDLDGKAIYKSDVNAATAQLDVSGLLPGIYLLVIQYNGGVARRKFVKL